MAISSICPPKSGFPFCGLPAPPAVGVQTLPEVNEADCHALWDKYEMLPNIRAHCAMVAHIAGELAARANAMGIKADVMATRAAGLLHDLAKTWSLRHGGSHDLLGASWVVENTGNYAIAQGVLLHVHWPWTVPTGAAICQLPIFILYADKRTRHAQCVSLQERFEDLIVRYGKTERSRQGIKESFSQAREIEKALSHQLGWNLHEYTFDSGRLVQ